MGMFSSIYGTMEGLITGPVLGGYGAIESFYTEGENPEEMLVFQHERGRLLTSTVPIAPRSQET